MAACEGIQDCLANGCEIDPAKIPMDELRKFVGPNASAANEPYIDIRDGELVLDGTFTFRQIIRLASILDH